MIIATSDSEIGIIERSNIIKMYMEKTLRY